MELSTIFKPTLAEKNNELDKKQNKTKQNTKVTNLKFQSTSLPQNGHQIGQLRRTVELIVSAEITIPANNYFLTN